MRYNNPTSYIAYFVILSIVYAGCSKTSIDPETLMRSIQGEWVDPAVTTSPNSTSGWTSGDVTYSPRNYHYTFNARANQIFNFTVSSNDIPVGIAIYDAAKNKVAYSSTYGNKQPCSFTSVSAGTYEVMVSTNQRGRVGRFTLEGTGLTDDLKQIIYAKLIPPQTPQPFTNDGGGGQEYSPKNQIYTFEVSNDNEPFDVNAIASTNNLWIEVYDKDNSRMYYSSYYDTGNVRSFVPDKISNNLKKGLYTLWVGTAKRDDPISARVEVIGNVQNLKLAIPQSSSISSSIQQSTNNFPSQLFQISVTADNSLFDLSAQSPNVPLIVEILDKNSNRIQAFYTDLIPHTVTKLNKGNYLIRATTLGLGSAKCDYTLIGYGQISSVSKL